MEKPTSTADLLNQAEESLGRSWDPAQSVEARQVAVERARAYIELADARRRAARDE